MSGSDVRIFNFNYAGEIQEFVLKEDYDRKDAEIEKLVKAAKELEEQVRLLLAE